MDGAGEPPNWHEPFDADYCRSFEQEVLAPIFEHYFRPRLIGAQHLPREGPLILAANHSGNAFPYDGMILDALLWKRDECDPALKFRSVYEKELALTWWMRPFGIDNFWRTAGGVDMSFDNFDRLLARGDRIIYYPEGVPGIGKGFHRRYQLQTFKTSFVTLAAKHGAPVYPCYIVNAEWVIPFTYTWRPLDRLMQRAFHVPFLPLPWGIIAILWPWTWYLTLPARMVFVIGDPIDVAGLAREAGIDPSNPDRAKLLEVAERVRRIMQPELTRHVRQLGRWPYQGRSLAKELARARGRWSKVVPPGWPVHWIRHHRDRSRAPARNAFHRWARDWDLLGFYLPAGWPFLSITRALRRPPCGYRGLSVDERRRLRGDFVWRLAEMPLPPRGSPPGSTAPGD